MIGHYSRKVKFPSLWGYEKEKSDVRRVEETPVLMQLSGQKLIMLLALISAQHFFLSNEASGIPEVRVFLIF